jgi:hypothetical protein
MKWGKLLGVPHATTAESRKYVVNDQLRVVPQPASSVMRTRRLEQISLRERDFPNGRT